MNNLKPQEYIKQLSNEDLMELISYISNDRDMNTSAFYPFFDFNNLDFLNSVYQSYKSIDTYYIDKKITEIIKAEIKAELFNRVEVDTKLIEKRYYESKSWNEVNRYIKFYFNGFTISSVLTKNVDKKHLPFSHKIEADPFFSSNLFLYSKSTDINTYNKNKHEALFDEAAVQNFIADHLDSIKRTILTLGTNDIKTQNYINFKKEIVLISEKKILENYFLKKLVQDKQQKEEIKLDYLSIVKSELNKFDIDQIDSFISKIDTLSKFLNYFQIKFDRRDLEELLKYASYRDLKDAENLDQAYLINIKQIAKYVKAEKYSQKVSTDMFHLEYEFDEQDRVKETTINQGNIKVYISFDYNQPTRSYYFNCRSNAINNNEGRLSKAVKTVERYNKRDLEELKVDDEMIKSAAHYLYVNGIQLELSDGFY